jgi:hypothetical protein
MTPATASTQLPPPTSITSSITVSDGSSSTPMVASSISINEILKWVCKVAVTTVGVSVWVYSVVSTDGLLLVVSREIIKYVTLPTLLCGWL